MAVYEFTLVAISEKKITVHAQNISDAKNFIQRIYGDTGLLEFTDDDVTSLSVLGFQKEEPVFEDENECCGCHTCGDRAGKKRENCYEECEECVWQCPGCGCCAHPEALKTN